MSAWVVSKRHIDVLVTLAAQQELLHGLSEDAYGAMLWAENHRSVNWRYTENTQTPKYSFEPCEPLPSPVVLIKAIACFDYQSCETEDYPETDAGRAMKELREAARIMLPAHLRAKEVHTLPGWRSAPWSIDEETDLT